MKLLSFLDFINEAEDVKLDKELREYTLTHVKDSMFQLRSPDYYKEFSVTPYKTEVLDKLKSAHEKLVSSIDELDASKLFDSVSGAELLDYSYGGVFPTEFSLAEVPEITMNLTDEQLSTFNTSPREFLLNNYSQLNKETKEKILDTLRERAEVLCAVVEALFYFIRTEDKENYYDGLNRDEILAEYDKAIEEVSKRLSFSYDGPFSDLARSPLSEDSVTAFWECRKNEKEFNISGTILPQELYAEENISKTKGLRLSLSGKGDTQPVEGYGFFEVGKLQDMVNQFYEKELS
jgi:hypothetical protein